jgi:hypothetical protein
MLNRPMTIGACFALLGILLGFTLGGAFGAAEDTIKGKLDACGTAVLATVYGGDVERKDAVVGRAWTYLQRAHLHGGAIGTAALASILALGLVCRAGALANLSALAFGLGALLYPLFWMLAAFRAPELGGTGPAKESLQWLAVPGAGLSILGALGTLLAVVQAGFGRTREPRRS